MFATLHYNQDRVLVGHPDYTTVRLACTNCRSRKLKCTGQRDGCNRCQARNVECEYPETSHGRVSKRFKSNSNKTSAGPDIPVTSKHTSTTFNTPSKALASAQDSVTRRPSHISTEDTSLASPSRTVGSLVDYSNDRLMFDEQQSIEKLNDEEYYNFSEDFQSYNNELFDVDGSLLVSADFPMSSDSSSNLFSLHSPPTSITSLSTTATSIEVESQGRNVGQSRNSVQAASLVPCKDTIGPYTESAETASSTRQRPAQGLVITQASKPIAPSTNSSVQASCQCVISALTLLETLVLEDVRLRLPNVAHLLHLKKRVISQCNVLLGCQRCISVSSFMILLIVLCQKMILSYERVLVILTEQYNRAHQQQHLTRPDAVSGHPADVIGGEAQQIIGNDYDLDLEEQPCVFGGLASMQLRRLAAFLVRVKVVLKTWNWDPHVKMVDSVEERVREQLRLFDKSSNV